MRGRIQPVKHDPGPDQIQIRLGQIQNGRAVGHVFLGYVDAGGFNFSDHADENFQLSRGESFIRGICR
jgi:hypothetical protein